MKLFLYKNSWDSIKTFTGRRQRFIFSESNRGTWEDREFHCYIAIDGRFTSASLGLYLYPICCVRQEIQMKNVVWFESFMVVLLSGAELFPFTSCRPILPTAWYI
jgi:hypothetical protein